MAAAAPALTFWCRFLDISPAFAFVFLVFPSLVCSLSFDLPSIGQDDNVSLKLDGDASITPQGIQLTPYYDELPVNNYKAGRAMHVESLHLWDNDSGDLAHFTTRFTFNIDSNGTTPYADGVAFFLAKFSKPLSSYPTYGNSLGLTQWKTEKALDPFVAVVFDTYSINKSRPLTNVSININSTLESVNITPWLNNVTQGKDNNASITYNASSKILQVVFTGFWNGQYLTDSLSCKVDLRKHLPQFITIGFSAATGIYSERNTVKSWQFNSTSLRSGSEGKNKKKGVVIGLSIGVPILVALLALGVCTYLKNKKMHADDEIIILGQAMDTEFQMASSGPKKFSYTELQTATNNFAEEHKLGEGGFGGVYRGFLRSLNMDVAVKRVSSGSKQGINEYASEVKIISRLRHRNLVPLHGWCHEKGELLLVYEYMPEGSLDSHLFKGKSVLNWGLRYRIAQGLASALFYLHEEWEKCVLHRDIKSSNVLLDSSFNAKLGDFGLAWLVDHEKPSEKTLVGGTPGYVAPECHFTFKTSKESDVYSFGIVALEIATGQRAIIFVEETEGFKRLVEWVWDLYGMGKLMEAADPKLCGNFERQEMEQLMMIGLWCAHPDSNFRPKISQALHGLQLQVQVPTLPPEMPLYSTSYNVPSFSNLRSQVFEGYTSPSNNSYPSHVTSSSATDASHSHTH